MAALGSARLEAAHERAQGELRLVLLQLDRDYEPPQVEEHRAILAAVVAGNRAAAAAALAAHLERAAERLIVLIRVRES